MLNRRFTNILIASYATPSGRRIINSFKPKISQIHEGANFARNRVIRHTTSISVTFLLGEIDVENVILRLEKAFSREIYIKNMFKLMK